MSEIELPGSYSWKGQLYGPGSANVPQELADAIAVEQKAIAEKAAQQQVTPVKLPDEQFEDIEENDEQPPTTKRKGSAR